MIVGTVLCASIVAAAGWSVRRGSAQRGLAAEALENSEEKYRMLLHEVQDHAIFALDPEGTVVSWNAGAEKMTGYPADEIIGRHFSCFYPPEDVDRGKPEAVLRMAAASGRHEEQGMRVRKDGSRFLASVALTALRDASGALRGFSEVSHDLSESEESLARYRGLLEAAPDAMVVVNQRGEIVLLNLQAERQFGYPRDELVGQKVTSIIPEGFAERLVADSTRSAADALAQQMGTGIELYGRRKNGGDFPIEIMLSPLDSAEGILVTAAIRDISVRKAAEKHLAHMESWHRGLVESAPDAIVIADAQGRIVLVNAETERLFGHPRGELMGQAVEILMPARFREGHPRHRQGYIAHPGPRPMGNGRELCGLRKDNSEFPVEISLRPLDTPQGLYIASAIRDITARKEALDSLRHREAIERRSAELSRSNDELQQFAYIAAHDLQEPLRMVASYTQLLSRRYAGRLDADADEFIAYAVDGAHRMQILIADMLAYCRVGTAGKELRETSSEAALDQAVLNLRGAIEESGAVVTHDPLPTVIADSAQFTQLFQNLVGNAIKYRSD